MMKRIILASKSPYRKELLQRLGISFECSPSNVNEALFKDQIKDPIELTRVLALEKAKKVANENQNALIIGSDQVCHIEGKILGKAGDLDTAFKQLSLLSAKVHELITSYTIIDGKNTVTKTNITKLYMRNLTDNQIKNYLRVDNPIDCAGSYKLELNGISLFSKIETDDHTAIIGLPLICLATELNKLSISIPPEL